MELRFCHAVHRPAERLSANVGFDLVAASVLGDLGFGLCHIVLSLTPKFSLGSGLLLFIHLLSKADTDDGLIGDTYTS